MCVVEARVDGNVHHGQVSVQKRLGGVAAAEDVDVARHAYADVGLEQMRKTTAAIAEVRGHMLYAQRLGVVFAQIAQHLRHQAALIVAGHGFKAGLPHGEAEHGGAQAGAHHRVLLLRKQKLHHLFQTVVLVREHGVHESPGNQPLLQRRGFARRNDGHDGRSFFLSVGVYGVGAAHNRLPGVRRQRTSADNG